MNYQNQGLNYLLKPKAEAGTVTPTRGFDNSHYHAKTEFVNCFNIHFTKKLQQDTYLIFKRTERLFSSVVNGKSFIVPF